MARMQHLYIYDCNYKALSQWLPARCVLSSLLRWMLGKVWVVGGNELVRCLELHAQRLHKLALLWV